MHGGVVRKLVVLALVAGVVAAVVKALRGDPAPQFSTHPSVTGGPPPEATSPLVPPPSAATTPQVEAHVWVAPVDGACPDGYPVKAKLSSGIFHVPGGIAYERTKPDRCYPTAEAAAGDGLRASKR